MNRAKNPLTFKALQSRTLYDCSTELIRLTLILSAIGYYDLANLTKNLGNALYIESHNIENEVNAKVKLN